MEILKKISVDWKDRRLFSNLYMKRVKVRIEEEMSEGSKIVRSRMSSKMKYGQWQEDDMSRALAAVRNDDMGVNEAARTYGTAVNGFAKTGVRPVNRDVFQNCHFVAAMQFETNDVPVMEACTIEPVNEEIPEPNRHNIKIPEKGSNSVWKSR
ncbi:hypothetical protein ANN_04071 [Periplaneta americana]|uniref:HTH psq-type domain-containing protein n=1 Tax=Periplaneta americana TaxID=6978 RepID=A0ABQ8T9Y7_PERAM|nr:hypothetical protein ANN_04071 [Periplaneta americana]